MFKDAMTVEEASTYLALPAGTIARLAEERRIPAARVDDQWVFSRKSLQKWQRLEAGRAGKR